MPLGSEPIPYFIRAANGSQTLGALPCDHYLWLENLKVVLATLGILLSFGMALPGPALCEERPQGFERWEKEIAAIEQREAERPPERGGIVFVGSSSIRMWNLQKSFPKLAAVNHGFGGSAIADSVHFIDRLVVPLEPKTVVFYAGDNDLQGGKSTAAVRDDFAAFVTGVQAKLPSTRIVFLAIKPSPSRIKLFEKQKEANALIREIIEQDPDRLVYVDVFGPMLNADGKPREELFLSDKLHLNDQGYALWTDLVKPHVD